MPHATSHLGAANTLAVLEGQTEFELNEPPTHAEYYQLFCVIRR